MRSHTGFTLIELLISIALGVTILLATTRIFIDSRESFLVQQQWTLLHEKGRHAIQFLTTELQMAGYPKTTFSGTPLSGNCGNGDGGARARTVPYIVDNPLRIYPLAKPGKGSPATTRLHHVAARDVHTQLLDDLVGCERAVSA